MKKIIKIRKIYFLFLFFYKIKKIKTDPKPSFFFFPVLSTPMLSTLDTDPAKRILFFCQSQTNSLGAITHMALEQVIQDFPRAQNKQKLSTQLWACG